MANESGTAPVQGRLDLMNPSELAKLGGIELIAKGVVEGFIMGLHRSPHRGFSAEFAEHRAYRPGDDLRYLDWRMFARSDRYHVKQFEEETNLRAYMLLDVSASMGWSSDPETLPTKLWYAKHLAAAISLVLIRQGDTVGLATFHDEITNALSPAGGRRQWHEILHQLDLLEAGGQTQAQTALRQAAIRLRRRGLVILISDLLVDQETTRTALRFLQHRGHEVLVFHLLDPGERELPAMSDARFYDPETGDELQVNVADMRVDYREAVREALTEWERSLKPHGVHYVVLDTNRPMAEGLRAYLHKRERLG